MANTLTLASLIANGGGVAEVLSALLIEQLWDPTDLRALIRQVPWDSTGSDTMTVTLDAVPGAFTQRTSETVGGFTNSAYTTDEFLLTTTRYGRIYQITNLFEVAGGVLTPEMIAARLGLGVGLTMTDLIAALFSSVANSNGDAGATGVALTVDTIYDAIYILNLSNVASGDASPLAFVGSPKQFNDLLASLRGETYETMETTESLKARGPGFKFRWNNIEFYQSDSTPDDATDYQGCLFGNDGFAYSMAPVDRINSIPAQNVLVKTPEFLLELDRDAVNGMTSLIGNIYPATAAVLGDAACKVTSVM